mgnify:CR=1 FL=1
MNSQIKELQNLYSWAELYKLNQNKKAYESVQKEIEVLRVKVNSNRGRVKVVTKHNNAPKKDLQ